MILPSFHLPPHKFDIYDAEEAFARQADKINVGMRLASAMGANLNLSVVKINVHNGSLKGLGIFTSSDLNAPLWSEYDMGFDIDRLHRYLHPQTNSDFLWELKIVCQKPSGHDHMLLETLPC